MLKAPENLSENEQVKLAAVSRINSRTYRAYLLKEELRALSRCSLPAAERHLEGWLTWAASSQAARIAPSPP